MRLGILGDALVEKLERVCGVADIDLQPHARRPRRDLLTRILVAISPHLPMWANRHMQVGMPTLAARKVQDVAAVIRAVREDAGLSLEVFLHDRLVGTITPDRSVTRLRTSDSHPAPSQDEAADSVATDDAAAVAEWLGV